MIYMRGQVSDYDGWRDMGNTGWGWADVLPYFKKLEDQYTGADNFHGLLVNGVSKNNACHGKF